MLAARTKFNFPSIPFPGWLRARLFNSLSFMMGLPGACQVLGLLLSQPQTAGAQGRISSSPFSHAGCTEGQHPFKCLCVAGVEE